MACARIGAVHSVVFAGFSAEALAQRIHAAQSKHVITADIGKRGGRSIPLKDIVDESLTKLDCDKIVKYVMVYERFYNAKHGDETTPTFPMKPKDIRMDPLIAVQRPYCPPVHLEAEDSLFILYTSGSTGLPKGLLHTTGGYALFAKLTCQTTFDLQPGDLFACVVSTLECHPVVARRMGPKSQNKMIYSSHSFIFCILGLQADIGWITGHTYVVCKFLSIWFTFCFR